jgi:copper chaperone CopZ
MKNIKVKTKGMHCPSCELLIKDSLEELKGIKKAEADHKSGIIEVDFNETKTSIDNIKKIIETEGYEIQ